MTQKSIFCPSKVSKMYEKAKVFKGKTLLSLIFPDKLLAENQYKLFNLSEPHANLLQLCSIPCDPMDCSPPGSSVHGILQARILEWAVMPSSGGSSQPRDKTYSLTSPAFADRFFFIINPTWEAQYT